MFSQDFFKREARSLLGLLDASDLRNAVQAVGRFNCMKLFPVCWHPKYGKDEAGMGGEGLGEKG